MVLEAWHPGGMGGTPEPPGGWQVDPPFRALRTRDSSTQRAPLVAAAPWGCRSDTLGGQVAQVEPVL